MQIIPGGTTNNVTKNELHFNNYGSMQVKINTTPAGVTLSPIPSVPSSSNLSQFHAAGSAAKKSFNARGSTAASAPPFIKANMPSQPTHIRAISPVCNIYKNIATVAAASLAAYSPSQPAYEILKQ